MNENKLIRIVLLILFLGLFFVYVIFFNLGNKEDSKSNIDNTVIFENSNKSNETNNNNGFYESSYGDDNLIINNSEENTVDTKNLINKKDDKVNTGEVLIKVPGFVDNSNDNGIIEEKEIKLPNLSGTDTFFGEIEVTKTLGLVYKYILKDKNGIYFVYMGTGVYDYEQSAKKLGGNIVKLNTELDLQKNKIPGDLAIYVNIPNITYIENPTLKRQVVFLVLFFGEEQWVLQIPYDKYHKNKKHIINIFKDLYNK